MSHCLRGSRRPDERLRCVDRVVASAVHSLLLAKTRHLSFSDQNVLEGIPQSVSQAFSRGWRLWQCGSGV